jgi:hypothetical protein
MGPSHTDQVIRAGWQNSGAPVAKSNAPKSPDTLIRIRIEQMNELARHG